MGKDNYKSESDNTKGKKKARKKFASYQIAKNLIKYNPHSELVESYRNSLTCMNDVTMDVEGMAHVHHCKNRWCPVCQSIRINKLIRGYKPQLQQFKELYFVTLTRPTVTEDGLKAQKDQMYGVFARWKRTKAYKAGKWSGLRKSECTIRPNNKYHFHFHVLIDSKEGAENLVSYWLKHNPDSDVKAQCIEKVDMSNDNSLLEIFKYFTKLISKIQSEGKQKRVVLYKRLDVIFRFMRGMRVFQPFGSLHFVEEEFTEDELKPDLHGEPNSIWRWVETDWYNVETGEALTMFKPSQSLINLLNSDSPPD